jgi:hypothetical protein
VLLRQVNQRYADDYELLMSSGLYQALVEKKLLVPHEEVALALAATAEAWKVIRPEPLALISYPYEWCFSQLKDAALLTLRIQRLALKHGMSLKDASAYNIQFCQGRPVLIDTLSFERYQEGEPWAGYKQFCQHFLAPLALMAYVDVRLGRLLALHLDGVPLDLATRLLPRRCRFKLGLYIHLFMHARSQQKWADRPEGKERATQRKVSRQGLIGLLDTLKSAIQGLKWRPEGTEWADYYNQLNYNDEALEQKAKLVQELVEQVAPRTVWDLGANVGRFSRIAAETGAFTVAFDIDPAAVEQHYLALKQSPQPLMLPLLMDLTNPSCALGWHHRERASLLDRGPVDVVMALALVHHLALSNNVPLPQLADFFAAAGNWLIVEFVPKRDSQVQKLLASREDIFPDYTEEGFEAAFQARYELMRRQPVSGSERTLYLMRVKGAS